MDMGRFNVAIIGSFGLGILEGPAFGDFGAIDSRILIPLGLSSLADIEKNSRKRGRKYTETSFLYMTNTNVESSLIGGEYVKR